MLETYAKAVCEITVCVNWELSFMRFQDSSKACGPMNGILGSKFELGHFEHDSKHGLIKVQLGFNLNSTGVD